MQAYRDERLAAAYNAGNEMPPHALRNWADYLGRLVPRRADARILDVGAGTGMLAVALADGRWTSHVIAIEPSSSMLKHARRSPGVTYVQARAEALPVRSQSVDCILLSRVVHHLTDLRSCAAEFLRTSRPGARLVVRTTVRERLDALVYDYFPELLTIDRQRFPSTGELMAAFGSAGWTVSATESHAEPVASSLVEYRDRLALRPQSKFTFLDDATFKAGLARISAAAERGGPTPVFERYDILVFEAHDR